MQSHLLSYPCQQHRLRRLHVRECGIIIYFRWIFTRKERLRLERFYAENPFDEDEWDDVEEGEVGNGEVTDEEQQRVLEDIITMSAEEKQRVLNDPSHPYHKCKYRINRP